MRRGRGWLVRSVHASRIVQEPVRITFKNLRHSAALEAAVRERVARLERVHPRIMTCHVVVEAPHRHQRKGRLFQVRIDLTTPGAEIVACRAPPQHGAHEDVYVALRDAFRAARRELLDHVRKRRGDVKLHEPSAAGTVVFLAPDHGFIASDDGRELYFHAHSVLDDFDDLELGMRVRFAEEMGEEGPQASTVERGAERPLAPR